MKNKDYTRQLLELFESENSGLFIAKEKPKGITADDRLAESFLEIINFVSENNRNPEIDADDIREALLAKRLESIIHTPEKVEALEAYDSLGLLVPPKTPESIEELLESDEFGIFGSEGNDIMNVKHVDLSPRAKSDEVARRKRASDFSNFSGGFKLTQKNLETGEKKLITFTNVNQIKEGRYYVSEGQMLYIQKIGEKKLVHGRMKSRIRAIFENGTESNMFLRSLSSQLYYDGYCVVHKDEILDNISNYEESVTGYIYIVRSLSEDPKINTIGNLYKIGYSKLPVSKRIANAKEDPTYLMADVEVIESYKLTGDYNPQKVEHMIHRVFSGAARDLNIIDKNGREYRPVEWYSVPINVIRQVVDLIDSGEIVHYVYDSNMQEMVEV